MTENKIMNPYENIIKYLEDTKSIAPEKAIESLSTLIAEFKIKAAEYEESKN
jgi:hypothetical protein